MRYFSKLVHQVQAKNNLQKAVLAEVEKHTRRIFDRNADVGFDTDLIKAAVAKLNAEYPRCAPMSVQVHMDKNDISIYLADLFQMTYYAENI